MNIGWPEGILLTLIALNFAMRCKKSGEARGEYDPVLYTIDGAIMLGLLWWGGFFA